MKIKRIVIVYDPINGQRGRNRLRTGEFWYVAKEWRGSERVRCTVHRTLREAREDADGHYASHDDAYASVRIGRESESK